MKLSTNIINNRYFANRKKNAKEREVRLSCWKNLREIDLTEIENKFTKHDFFYGKTV